MTRIIMAADDPRHGTTRGYDAHRRNEGANTVCGPCRAAAAAYEYRRRIDSILGRPRTTSGLGTARRVQALVALGYTFGQIGAEFDRSQDWAAKIAHRPNGTIRTSTASKIAELYRRWSMALPDETTGRQRHAASYARSTARRYGWAPPLAWDDIDDPEEQPTGWTYQAADRHAQLDDLIASGAWLSEACRVLGITAETLEKWADRHGRREDYNRLVRRERGAA